MRMRGLGMVVVLAGCLSKPTKAIPGDASDPMCVSTTPGVAFTTTSQVATLPGDVELAFATGSNHPTLGRLEINGVQVIADPEGCTYEDQVGIAVYPAYSVSASSARTEPQLQRVVGPAYTEVEATWTHSFDCGTASSGHGSTVWSLFPDGRIVRVDTLAPSSETTTVDTNCDCTGAVPSSFIVTSYLALETSEIETLTFASGATRAPQLGVPQETTLEHGGCASLVNSAGRVAIRWDDLSPPPFPPQAPTRIRTVVNGSHTETAFVYDLVPAGETSTLAFSDVFQLRTHLLLDGSAAGSCTQMLARLEAFANVSGLMVDGVAVAYTAQGVFDDVHSTGNDHTAPVTVTTDFTPIPPGFVVAVRFSGAQAITTSRPAADVVWQREPDGTFYVFFRNGLDVGQSLTISPAC